MQTAFITGATGFLGRNLVAELLAQGYTKIYAFHRPTANVAWLAAQGVELRAGRIDDFASIMQAMPLGVDTVFHCAANTNLWFLRNPEQTRDNVLGTRNVVSAAIERGARRFIHTSSILAFGLHKNVINEETPTNAPASWINYLRTKHLAELEVLAGIKRGLDAVILNPGHIIGPYDNHNWARMMRGVIERRLPAIPPGMGTFACVHEVARAHVAAVTQGRCGERYILGGIHASYADMVATISRVTGVPTKARVLPPPVIKLYAQMCELGSRVTRRMPEVTPEMVALSVGPILAASSKAERELNYQYPSLEAMLTNCYRWLKTEKEI